MENNTYKSITWEYFKSLVKNVLAIDFIKTDDFFNEDMTWVPIEEFEELDDYQIVNSLASLRDFEGTLHVITDASYQNNLGPFIVESVNLKEFVKSHRSNFGERFLETDVLIFNIQSKLIWIFHHEGICTFFDYNRLM